MIQPHGQVGKVHVYRLELILTTFSVVKRPILNGGVIMGTELLVRDMVCKKKADPVDELNDSLMVSSARLLGYSLEPSHLERWVAEKEEMIEKALKDLDIRPFTNESVQAYKDTVTAEERKKLKPTAVKVSDGAMWAFFVSAPLAVGLVLSGAVAAIWGNHEVLLYAAAAPGFTALISVIVGMSCADAVRAYDRISISWNGMPISRYDKRVPEFALQTACDLKEKCPEAGIYIEELRVESRPAPDPFLVVQIKHPSYDGRVATRPYYLEVWNEPKYKQEREV